LGCCWCRWCLLLLGRALACCCCCGCRRRCPLACCTTQGAPHGVLQLALAAQGVVQPSEQVVIVQLMLMLPVAAHPLRKGAPACCHLPAEVQEQRLVHSDAAVEDDGELVLHLCRQRLHQLAVPGRPRRPDDTLHGLAHTRRLVAAFNPLGLLRLLCTQAGTSSTQQAQHQKNWSDGVQPVAESKGAACCTNPPKGCGGFCQSHPHTCCVYTGLPECCAPPVAAAEPVAMTAAAAVCWTAWCKLKQYNQLPARPPAPLAYPQLLCLQPLLSPKLKRP
jgi:hypothetical protein